MLPRLPCSGVSLAAALVNYRQLPLDAHFSAITAVKHNRSVPYSCPAPQHRLKAEQQAADLAVQLKELEQRALHVSCIVRNVLSWHATW